MSWVNLLNMPKDTAGKSAFFFEHDQQHRHYVEKTGDTSRILDPTRNVNVPATNWHQNHQQLHDDLVKSLQLAPNQILQESNLGKVGDLKWWLFANHQEHYVTNSRLP